MESLYSAAENWNNLSNVDSVKIGFPSRAMNFKNPVNHLNFQNFKMCQFAHYFQLKKHFLLQNFNLRTHFRGFTSDL